MDFKKTFSFWGDQTLAMRSEASLVELIFTGAKSYADLKPDTTAINALGPKEGKLRVLDFGCGVGRNLYAMPKTWEVTGYDNDNMLVRVPDFFAAQGGRSTSDFTLTSDWDAVKSKEFDVVLASLVFQHVPINALEVYLQDLQKMSPLLVIWGRCWNDINNRQAYFPLVLKYFDVAEDIKWKSLDDNVLVVATSKVKEVAKPVVVKSKPEVITK